MSFATPLSPPGPLAGRIPLALPALGIGLGAALGLGLASGPPAGLAALGLLAAPLLLLGVMTRRARILAWSLLIGLLLGRHAAVLAVPPPALAGLDLPAIYMLHGQVLDVSLPARGAQRFTLSIEAIGDPPVALERTFPVPVTMRERGRSRWRWEDLTPGARLSVLARVDRRRRGIRAVATDRRGVTVHARGDGATADLARVRRRASWAFARHLGWHDSGLARAMILGDRGRLAHHDRDLFRATGQAHLLAVSGLHVGLLLGGLILVLRALGVPQRMTWIAGILTAALYVPLTGAPPSAVRAGLGASAWFIGALCMRSPRGLALLTLVGLIVLVAAPASLRSVSFQLSFAAVTSILTLSTRIRSLLVADRPVIAGLLAPQRTPIRTSLAVSLAAWLGTAPFVATHIGRLCVAAALIAVPAIPITAVLLGAGFILLLARDVTWITDAAGPCFSAAAYTLRLWLGFVQDLGLGARPTRVPEWGWWLLYATAFGLAARAGHRAMRAGLATMVVLLLILLLPFELRGLSHARDTGDNARPTYHATTPSMPSHTATIHLEGVPAYAGIAVGLLVFAALAIRLGWLQRGGALAAGLLGMTAACVFGWGGLLALLAPFLVATVLGKLPGAERAGARGVRQVLSNGLPALLGAGLALAGRPDLGEPFFLGALACLGADTCATEIGVRFGGAPFRLAGRGTLTSGDSGGVTIAGLLASLGGALLAPAAFALVTDLPWATVGLLSAAGVAGGLLDSVLGGTLQFRGRDPSTRRETERRSTTAQPLERIRGLRWLDNDGVNLVTGLAAAIIAVALATLA